MPCARVMFLMIVVSVQQGLFQLKTQSCLICPLTQLESYCILGLNLNARRHDIWTQRLGLISFGHQARSVWFAQSVPGRVYYSKLLLGLPTCLKHLLPWLWPERLM